MCVFVCVRHKKTHRRLKDTLTTLYPPLPIYLSGDTMACSPPLTINESEIAQLLQGYRLALKVFDSVLFG
jgi:adenosylmethionine-8-amino-7-oxononanoate aminotransferase